MFGLLLTVSALWKFSAWVQQNLASALILNQKQKLSSWPVRDLLGSWQGSWIGRLCERGVWFLLHIVNFWITVSFCFGTLRKPWHFQTSFPFCFRTYIPQAWTMEKWDGNEGTSAFHVPEWMVSSLVALLFLLFLDYEATTSDRWQGSLVRSSYQNLWLGKMLLLIFLISSYVLCCPCFLITSKAGEGLRAAWLVSFLPGCLCCWCTAWVILWLLCIPFASQCLVSHGEKGKRKQAYLALLCFTGVAFLQIEGKTFQQQKKKKRLGLALLWYLLYCRDLEPNHNIFKVCL